MSTKKKISGLKLVDKGLKLLQDSFNVNNNFIDFSDILAMLEYQSAVIKDIQAKKLVDKYEDIKILQQDNLLTRVENITSQLGLDSNDIQVIKLTEDLIKDLSKAKGWLGDYAVYVNNMGSMTNQSQLLALGIAILGRAVELCPIKTGLLRRSGIVIQQGNSVTVAFTVPYAIYVHENMDNYHPVGQAKFLETAAQEFLPEQTVYIEAWENGGVAIRIELSDLRR